MKSTELSEGQWFVCLPGFNKEGNYTSKNSGGSGYEEGRVFKAKSFSNTNKGELAWVVWPQDGASGVFCQALRPATQWEIEHGEVQLIPNYEIY